MDKQNLLIRLLLLLISFFLLAIPLLFIKPKTAKTQRLLRLTGVAIFITIIIVGLTIKEYNQIYVNAINLCLSCIGIK